MLCVEHPDGSKSVTLTQNDLLPAGGSLEWHWACVMEGSDEWCLPPQGAVLPGGTNDAGDGKASRTPFGGDGKIVMQFPRGVGDDVARLVGIVVRNNSDWLHADVGDLTIPLMTPTPTGSSRRCPPARIRRTRSTAPTSTTGSAGSTISSANRSRRGPRAPPPSSPPCAYPRSASWTGTPAVTTRARTWLTCRRSSASAWRARPQPPRTACLDSCTAPLGTLPAAAATATTSASASCSLCARTASRRGTARVSRTCSSRSGTRSSLQHHSR